MRAFCAVRLGLVVVLVLLFLCAAVARPGSASSAVKPGRPFLGPTLPSIRTVERASSRAPLLVELKRGRRGVSATRVMRTADARLISADLHIWLLPGSVARRRLPSLLHAGVIAGVEPIHVLQASVSLAFSDPLYQTEWWRAAVGADAVTPPGPGVPIAILDTGLDVTHPEFSGRPNTTLLNPQVLTDSSDEWHGTAVASVAAAPANGAGIVGIYPSAALGSWDARELTNADAIAGILKAADNSPTVINMSFGSDTYDPMLEQAVLIAFGEGSLLVAAAGNEYNDGNPLEYPASLNHVLTIAATDEKNNSSYFSSASEAVDLAAPGQDIVAAIPSHFDSDGWAAVDGTSFSAPIVSAATAWVWTVRNDLDQTQIFDLMRFSARDVGDQGFDEDTGFGLLDIPAALSAKAPSSDYQEPNDDIYMVKKNGLFANADEPLTRPGHGRATIHARLDSTEDPEDIYRVWVPAHRVVRARLVGDANVNIELWRLGTKTVFERGTAMRRDLIDRSEKPGTKPERVRVENDGSRGTYVYADIYPGENVPNAFYTLSLTTSRR